MKREEYLVRAHFYADRAGEIVINTIDTTTPFGPCSDRNTAEAIVVVLAGRTDCFAAEIEIVEKGAKP